MKYTTKELNNIAGVHDPFHCHLEDCQICINFWSYASLLRQQSETEDKSKRHLKRVFKPLKKTTLANIKGASTKDAKKLVREFPTELSEAINNGYTVRGIAFQMDCEDAVVVKALDYLHLSPKTRSQLNLEAYRDELKELVHEGFSIKGIAHKLNKNHLTIGSYLTKYGLVRPNVHKLTLDEVEYQSGQKVNHRYFNSLGQEVEIKVIEES